MNGKVKAILMVIVFALFLGIAVFAYNILGKKVSPQNDIGMTQNKDKESPAAPDTESETEQGAEQNAGKDAEQDTEKEKTKAPDFTVIDTDGNSVKLSDLSGKPIVLNFWASWCPPCKSEMPEFNTVYEEVGEDITFMMVDLVDGQRETKENGAQYIQEQGFSFPVYFDTEQDAANAYGIVSIPTTIFIDKDGYIAAGAQNAIDAETLRKGIDLVK